MQMAEVKSTWRRCGLGTRKTSGCAGQQRTAGEEASLRIRTEQTGVCNPSIAAKGVCVSPCRTLESECAAKAPRSKVEEPMSHKERVKGRTCVHDATCCSFGQTDGRTRPLIGFVTCETIMNSRGESPDEINILGYFLISQCGKGESPFVHCC